MSLKMMAELSAAVDSLEKDPPVAVLIHGQAPGGFCAGGDLRDVRGHLLAPGAAADMVREMSRVTASMARLPAVIVAAVEGSALGGGAELSQVADWVVMGDSARIGFVHARLGVSPGWGGASLLMKRVGRAASVEVLLRAQAHSVESAMALGLADQRAPDGEAVPVAEEWLNPILEAAPAAIRGALEVLRSSSGGDVGTVERRVFQELWAAQAHLKALDQTRAGR